LRMEITMQNNQHQSVIVFGPAGCGKTRHAQQLKQHLGMQNVVDDWVYHDPLPPNTLVLTNDPRVNADTACAVAFSSLVALLAVDDERTASPAPSDAPPALEANAANTLNECIRECIACDWVGQTDTYLAGRGDIPPIGPLCPVCGEVTEIVPKCTF
jgi:hypothetical protein